jgi:glyoxylase-like metal-dependent hydrolase (beta-lactamase superfamily II)
MYPIKTQNEIRIDRLLYGTNNVYYIHHPNCNIIVDTGQPSRRKKLYKRIIKNEYLKGKLDYLILTHTHFDHCRNAAFLKQAFQLKVICSEMEAESLAKGYTKAPRGTNYLTDFISFLGSKFPKILSYQAVKADITVKDSYTIPEAEEIQLFLSPGHTDGSLSIIIDDSIILSGDNLFGMIPGRVYPPFADDKKQLIHAWEKYLNTNANIFLPGHGKPIKKSLLEKQWKKYAKKILV